MFIEGLPLVNIEGISRQAGLEGDLSISKSKTCYSETRTGKTKDVP